MISLRNIAVVLGLALPLSLAAAAAPAWAGTASAGGSAVGAGVLRPAVCPLSMTWDGVTCR